MKEDFLHYLWKYKLYATQELRTTKNEELVITYSGEHNFIAGPDFFNGQLKINNQLWAGNVEIHLKSSDWYVHGHEKDIHYDNVILHVVWEHDVEVYRKDNTTIPTLELKKYISKDLLNNYKRLFSSKQKWINCENDIATIDKFKLSSWLERLYVERLEQKSKFIGKLLVDSKNDWEAVLFKLLAKNFGLKVNADAFFNLVDGLDFGFIRKQQYNLASLEALLFGQANLLNDTVEDQYYIQLQEEYQYLKSKYGLFNNSNVPFQFFRLRPNNFPTIRIAQLAALYHQEQNLFSKIIAITDSKEYYDLFDISMSNYWQTHYSFSSISKKSHKKLSMAFVDLLIVNTIIPIKFMYLKSIDKLDEAQFLNTIKQIKPEKNTIINEFNNLSITSENALESQALLQLKNEYCSKQKCLHCAVGNELLNICN